MSVTFESVRFGAVEIPESEVIEFPNGLIGLGGDHWALLDRNPGTGFLWLHCVEDPALALPVVGPELFFPEFELELGEDELAAIGFEDLGKADIYVTVRATPNPLEATANLRAPLVIHAGRGFQVLNAAEGAELQAPLFELATPQAEGAPVDAA
jgi:flagellar assembly factor FliW